MLHRTIPFTFQYASIKPQAGIQVLTAIIKFTFQYASIKPWELRAIEGFDFHLHFNMLLLNP